jgi:hypothetical protein
MPKTSTPNTPQVDHLRDELLALVQERQNLRSSGAGSESLERNRQAIVSRQWEYSRALIARYAA